MAADDIVRLVGGDLEKRLVRHGLDQAVAKKVERRAEGSHGLIILDACGEERRDALLNLRVYRAVVNERAAGRVHEVAEHVLMPGAKLVNLADRAGNRVLVALRARLRGVDRPESVLDFVADFEGLAVKGVL